MDEKILRGKKFHNKRFSKETRESAWKYYSIEKRSRECFFNNILTSVLNKKVLELGCGKGDKSIDIAEKGGIITGIDISEVAISKAKEIVDKSNFSNPPEF